MGSLAGVKAGLKARFAAYLPDGVRCYAEEPASPATPAVIVYGPIEGTRYDTDFDGVVLWNFAVIVLVPPADLTRAQDAMNAYLSPTGARSLRAALREDESLGGVAHYARVIGVEEPPRLVDDAGVKHLRACVRVEVRAE